MWLEVEMKKSTFGFKVSVTSLGRIIMEKPFFAFPGTLTLTCPKFDNSNFMVSFQTTVHHMIMPCCSGYVVVVIIIIAASSN